MKIDFLSKIAKAIINAPGKLFENPFRKLGISWLTIKKLKHLDYNVAGKININGRPVSYQHPPELIHSLREIFIDEVYKIAPPEPSPFIIDCGANIGLSVIYLKQKMPQAKIIAFEPDETNFKLLKQNTEGLSDLLLINKPVWDREENLFFEMKGTQSSAVDASSKNAVKPIIAARLKDYLDQTVFFLKIDIEGAEYRVIKDCESCLDRVQHVFIEYHGSFEEQFKLLELLEILSRSGFQIYLKEADNVYPHPYSIISRKGYDVQLNIFGSRANNNNL